MSVCSLRFDLLSLLFLFLFLVLTNKKFMANLYNSAKEGVDTNDVLSFPTGRVRVQAQRPPQSWFECPISALVLQLEYSGVLFQLLQHSGALHD